jgi:hypothetical protein
MLRLRGGRGGRCHDPQPQAGRRPHSKGQRGPHGGPTAQPRAPHTTLGIDDPVFVAQRCQISLRTGIPPGKSLTKPETGAAFLATPADSGRQRPRSPASPAAKPRKVKGYSERARKPELRGTAWWARQDSNLPPPDYGDMRTSTSPRRLLPSITTGAITTLSFDFLDALARMLGLST